MGCTNLDQRILSGTPEKYRRICFVAVRGSAGWRENVCITIQSIAAILCNSYPIPEPAVTYISPVMISMVYWLRCWMNGMGILQEFVKPGWHHRDWWKDNHGNPALSAFYEWIGWSYFHGSIQGASESLWFPVNSNARYHRRLCRMSFLWRWAHTRWIRPCQRSSICQLYYEYLHRIPHGLPWDFY